MKLFPLIFILLFPSLSMAQIAHGASGLDHGVPDFCATSDSTIVPALETKTFIGGSGTCLGIHGTAILTGSRLIDNILVYSDGTLICNGGEIIIRDKVIDTKLDPEQYGQGIIAFGTVKFDGCIIKSQNPTGVRGHTLYTQRADVDIRNSQFINLGRTTIAPLNSTTFSGDTVTHVGTQQIGRYPVHFHHLMGPLPGSGKDYQFQFVNNKVISSSKWGIAVHNSHYGLLQDNDVRQIVAYCFVEENGSESANKWIHNYCGQSPDLTRCRDFTYDPEFTCPGGFAFRGRNQFVLNNTVEDTVRAYTWWPRCLEPDGPPCGSDLRITSPLFPGADTTNPAQIHNDCRSWSGGDQVWKDVPCTIAHQPGQKIDGNIARRAGSGFEFFWDNSYQKASPPITNSITEDVGMAIFLRYSDVGFDGFKATGCDTFAVQGNDGSTTVVMAGESSFRHVTSNCKTIFTPVGQLQLGPAYHFFDSAFTSTNGLSLRLGGQKAWCCSMTTTVTVENSTFNGPVFTQQPSTSDAAPGQLVIIRQNNVNGLTKEDRLLFPGRNPDPEVVLSIPGFPMTGNALPPVVIPPPVGVPSTPVPVPVPTPTPSPVPVLDVQSQITKLQQQIDALTKSLADLIVSLSVILVGIK